jgi:hypothetical protein
LGEFKYFLSITIFSVGVGGIEIVFVLDAPEIETSDLDGAENCFGGAIGSTFAGGPDGIIGWLAGVLTVIIMGVGELLIGTF